MSGRNDSPVAEFTARAIVTGVLLGLVFGAANAYLGLRVGLTVSASIPAAVMTVALFRLTGSRGTILEANLSQTIGSASTSLASGTIFTIPAALPLGHGAALSPGRRARLSRRRPRARGDDPAAPPAHRGRPRRAALSGGHGLRRGPARRPPEPPGRAPGSSAAWRSGRRSSWPSALLFLFPSELSARLPVLPKAELALELAPALLAVGYILGYRAVRRSSSRARSSPPSSLIPLIGWIGSGLPLRSFPRRRA